MSNKVEQILKKYNVKSRFYRNDCYGKIVNTLFLDSQKGTFVTRIYTQENDPIRKEEALECLFDGLARTPSSVEEKLNKEPERCTFYLEADVRFYDELIKEKRSLIHVIGEDCYKELEEALEDDEDEF